MSEIPDFLRKEREAAQRRRSAVKNNLIYRFYEDHKIIIRIAAIVVIILTIIIGSAIRKHNTINSLYEQAVAAQQNGNYDTALSYLENILHMDKDNKKATELYPVIEEAAHKNKVNDSLNNAVYNRDNGNYISAYNYAQSAYSYADQYGYSDEKAMAEQIMNETLPLKEQQEAEQKAQAEAEAQKKAEAQAQAEEKARAQAEAEAQAQAEAQMADEEETRHVYVRSCTTVKANTLLRSPSTYTNTPINISGSVVSQINLQQNKLDSALEALGIYESENLEEVIIDDGTGEIAVLYDPDDIGGIRLLNGDEINVYGDCLGLTELTSTNIYGTESSYKIPQVRLRYF